MKITKGVQSRNTLKTTSTRDPRFPFGLTHLRHWISKGGSSLASYPLANPVMPRGPFLGSCIAPRAVLAAELGWRDFQERTGEGWGRDEGIGTIRRQLGAALKHSSQFKLPDIFGSSVGAKRWGCAWCLHLLFLTSTKPCGR